jgi:hypothetical protein
LFEMAQSQRHLRSVREVDFAELGKSPANWVWHHDVEAGVMQLVPKSQHTTGSIFWNTLHPNGVGGMSIWNTL